MIRLKFIADIDAYDRVYFTNNDPNIRVIENALFWPPNPGRAKRQVYTDYFGRNRLNKVWISAGAYKQAKNGVVAPTQYELAKKYGEKRLQWKGKDPTPI